MLVPEIFIAKRSKPCGSSIEPDPQNAQCMTKRFPHGVQGWSDSLYFLFGFWTATRLTSVHPPSDSRFAEI